MKNALGREVPEKLGDRSLTPFQGVSADIVSGHHEGGQLLAALGNWRLPEHQAGNGQP